MYKVSAETEEEPKVGCPPCYESCINFPSERKKRELFDTINAYNGIMVGGNSGLTILNTSILNE